MTYTQDRSGERSGDGKNEPGIRDEDGRVREAFRDAVEAAIEARNGHHVRDLASDLHEADLGSLIEALPREARPRLIELMGESFDFAALTEVDDAIREEILEALSPDLVARGVEELESDDAVFILEDLEAEDRAEILQNLSPSDRFALQRSLDFPEGSAGRLMRTSLIVMPPGWTVGQAIDQMREAEPEDLPDSFFEVFVVDPAHRFLGNVFLDALLRARRMETLENIMNPERLRARATDESIEVARQFERYNVVSVPVVDEADRLLGVITIDDIVDVIREEADEQFKAIGGVDRDAALSDTIVQTTRSRFLWLFVNLVTAFCAASVLGLFEVQLQKMVALAVLVSIVASQGGNAATQTMTVVVRALATRELHRRNAVRVIRRELVVGAINGVGFGVITGLAAHLWYGTWGLGIVVFLAMTINLVAGALGGIVIPMILDRFDLDPAVASGAFVTTVTDVVGNFSFLGIATVWFALA